MKKKLIIGMILCLLFLFFSCSGNKQKGPVVLNLLMEALPNTDYVMQYLPEFEAKTGIKVNIEALTYTAIHEKLIPQLTGSKSSYDVIVVDKQWVGEFVGAGWLEPLEDYIKKDNFDVSGFIPAMMNQIGRVDNMIYLLPFYNYSMGLVYRKDLFEDPDLRKEFREKHGKDLEVPATVDDYLTVAKFFTRTYKGQQMYGIVPQLARGVGIHAEWANLMFGAGGNYYDSAWNVTVNTGGSLKAAQILLELYNTAAPKGATAYDFDEVVSLLSQGQGAMASFYGNMVPILNDPDKSTVAGNFELTVMPGGHGVGGGWGWAIPKNCAQKEAAWKFLSWVADFDMMKKMAVLGGGPVRNDIFNDSDVKAAQPGFIDMQRVVSSGMPMPIMLKANMVVDVMARELSEMVNGNKTPQAAMDAAAGELHAFIQGDPLIKK